MHLKMSSVKWSQLYLGLIVLSQVQATTVYEFANYVLKITVTFLGANELTQSHKNVACSITFKSVCQLWNHVRPSFDGSVQDNSISSALAMGILQSCTKPSIYTYS